MRVGRRNAAIVFATVIIGATATACGAHPDANYVSSRCLTALSKAPHEVNLGSDVDDGSQFGLSVANGKVMFDLGNLGGEHAQYQTMSVATGQLSRRGSLGGEYGLMSLTADGDDNGFAVATSGVTITYVNSRDQVSWSAHAKDNNDDDDDVISVTDGLVFFSPGAGRNGISVFRASDGTRVPLPKYLTSRDRLAMPSSGMRYLFLIDKSSFKSAGKKTPARFADVRTKKVYRVRPPKGTVLGGVGSYGREGAAYFFPPSSRSSRSRHITEAFPSGTTHTYTLLPGTFDHSWSVCGPYEYEITQGRVEVWDLRSKRRLSYAALPVSFSGAGELGVVAGKAVVVEGETAAEQLVVAAFGQG